MAAISVPTYAKCDDAGGGAYLALHSALLAMGYEGSYGELLVYAGAAFTFVYDNASVYEPLRDLTPVDGIRLATRASGLNGRWLVGGDCGDTLEQVADSLADGRPAVVSLYSVKGHHGYAVAVDCDPAARTLTIQAGQPGGSPAAEPIREQIVVADGWWGAVTGPQAWAACPVFLVERSRLAGWAAEGRLQRALVRGIQLMRGGTVPYHDCPGSQEYSNIPLGGRHAVYGLPAYDLLAADVGGAEWLGGFDVIWRLDAQLTQLKHHRSHAGDYLKSLPGAAAADAAATCQVIADLAEELASRFWYRPTRSFGTATDVIDAVDNTPALLAWINLPPEERTALEKKLPVAQTAWGPVVVADTPARRKDASALVGRLRASEQALLAQLERYVGSL